MHWPAPGTLAIKAHAPASPVLHHRNVAEMQKQKGCVAYSYSRDWSIASYSAVWYVSSLSRVTGGRSVQVRSADRDNVTRQTRRMQAGTFYYVYFLVAPNKDTVTLAPPPELSYLRERASEPQLVLPLHIATTPHVRRR